MRSKARLRGSACWSGRGHRHSRLPPLGASPPTGAQASAGGERGMKGQVFILHSFQSQSGQVTLLRR